MKVKAMLESKGTKVETVASDATIETAVHLLKLQKIGAVVVSDDKKRVQGILSERDIVRALASHGGATLQLKVADLMTREVKTTTPEVNVKDVMIEMTRGRFRHLPVLEEGQLAGIVSIGDVVKNRLDELETETNVLRDYIVGRT